MTNVPYSTLVSSDDLLQHVNDPAWIVFDCRFVLGDPDEGRRRYLEGHMPNARYADLNKDLSSPATARSGRHPLPNAAELTEKLRAWGVNDDSQVVVYDDAAGAIAGRMWWLLRYLGHKNAAVLDGGLKKWIDENKPMQKGEAPASTPGNFSGEPNDEAWIETAELERIRGREDVVIIDARAPERYSGEKENVDAEGGHIPGSINHPLQTNLDETGCFRPADELRAMYSGLHKPQTIHSCGSGVTACHNLLAMEIAGFPATRLYVGSWSEWIRSPQRPRAVGKAPG